MNRNMDRFPLPWLFRDVVLHLTQGNVLAELTGPRQSNGGFDVRERSLEKIAQDVMISTFGQGCVIKTRNIGRSLGLNANHFPATAQPDIVAIQDDHFHICEIKSSRTDYSRFDCVFESKPFRAYLNSVGHDGKNPWEVEQDLIKLHLYKGLSDKVGS